MAAKCNRPQPAINPQQRLIEKFSNGSVIDPSLRSIRNKLIHFRSPLRSVIDPSLRSIRNRQLVRVKKVGSVIDPSLRSIRNSGVRTNDIEGV